MKKNTVKVLLLVTLGILSGTVNAQNAKQKEWLKQHSDMTRINAHVAQYKAEFEADLAEANKQAAINNWPLEIRENRGYSKLIKVGAEGEPIYLSTFNEGSAITSRTNYLQPGGSLGLDLTGLFMTVGVWDGEYPLSSHEDFAGRYTSNDGPPNPVATHPTHVLGTIMGSGASSAAARGMAYEAEASVANFANDFSEMANVSGSLILSNHSYGFGNPSTAVRGSYVRESQQVDEITYDAPYYQPVFAAGNDGNGAYDRLSDRGCSKNGITVAAIVQPVVNTDGTISPTAVTIAGFSSWGPTNDRRIKPDVANKGVHVWSTVDKNLATGAASDTAHDYLDGTSMATPGVTGALLLVQQHYSNLYGDFMLSSTVRALVAHTADEVGADGPDAQVGWGVINVKAAAETITNRGTSSIIKEGILAAGTVFEGTFNAIAGQPLTATLAWTDPAGAITSGNASVLVNDLDIRITSNDSNVVSFPWKLATSNSANAVTGDNSIDNIEKVQIASASGSYTVRISHKGTTLVNPNAGGVAQQQYSLIITGTDGVLSTDPVKAVDSAFKVWPNPAQDVVNISIKDGIESNASVIIYDVQGRNVKHAALTGSENTVNVQDLTSGVYFVNVTNGIKKDTKKLVIK
ncbi:S8 family serine peptidase [Flavobacterium rivuli]|uniref:S8 family serine peptidase n=1 Tax=Flavobacterium rivuli TaxID=498301 RepID=UPI00035EAF46|nr:S8 family serine peptidase [Flavobacterium rivuli]